MAVFLLLALHTAAALVLGNKEECIAGTMWQKECNSCFCTLDGQAACTMKECSVVPEGALESRRPFSDFYRPLTSPPAEPLEERTAVCRQNDTWTEQCNQCACIADGTAVCTRMECKAESLAAEAAARIGHFCETGDSWSAGCTSCHCLHGGQVVCSHALCGQHRQRRATCRPGSQRKVDCNTCLCLSDGTEACSRRLCNVNIYDGSGLAACKTSCPADCGRQRLANGCLLCQCGPQPFFMTHNLLPTFSTSSSNNFFSRERDDDFDSD